MRLDDLLGTVLATVPAHWVALPASPVAPQYVGEVSGGGQRWLEVYEHRSLFVLRSDVRVSFAMGLPAHGDDELTFEFSRTWPDKRVRAFFADVLYGGHVVHRRQLLSVDGHRAYLPTPDYALARVDERTVPEAIGDVAPTHDVQLARLADELAGHRDFERYFDQSGIVEIQREI